MYEECLYGKLTYTLLLADVRNNQLVKRLEIRCRNEILQAFSFQENVLMYFKNYNYPNYTFGVVDLKHNTHFEKKVAVHKKIEELSSLIAINPNGRTFKLCTDQERFIFSTRGDETNNICRSPKKNNKPFIILCLDETCSLNYSSKAKINEDIIKVLPHCLYDIPEVLYGNDGYHRIGKEGKRKRKRKRRQERREQSGNTEEKKVFLIFKKELAIRNIHC